MCTTHVGNATKIIWKDGKLNVKAFSLPCNKWDCPKCAKKKAIILGNRVKDGFKGERIRFATFTDQGKGSLSQRLQALKTAWNRLRLSLTRHYGLTKFFWVLEFGGKGGRPHLHCLLNCFVPQRELSILAERAGFGSIVDIREVKNGGGFGYVFKYLHKDCGLKAGAAALRLIHGRRFGVSRNIRVPQTETLPSQTAVFTQGAMNSKQREEIVRQIANAVGSSSSLEKRSEGYVSYIVDAPKAQWQGAFGAPQFALACPTYEHLQALYGSAVGDNGWMEAENSREALECVNIPLHSDNFLEFECQKLTLLNPKLFSDHRNAFLNGGVVC